MEVRRRGSFQVASENTNFLMVVLPRSNPPELKRENKSLIEARCNQMPPHFLLQVSRELKAAGSFRPPQVVYCNTRLEAMHKFHFCVDYKFHRGSPTWLSSADLTDLLASVAKQKAIRSLMRLYFCFVVVVGVWFGSVCAPI